MSELPWLTLGEAAAAYTSRRLSPVELTQALLDRIRAVDGRVNAFVQLDAEGAMVAARAAEREITAGRVRGPLHGVPVAVKDMIDVASLRTTCHSKVLLHSVARRDANAVERLRKAGAIVLGKLAQHEFAFGPLCFDLPFPPARNPWNLDHYPGGSSSGSGAAVAAGFVPLALGTDTSGSIRNPAGACGAVGLKPTYDLISREGVFPLAFTLDHVGPIARSVRDIATALAILRSDDQPTRSAAVDLEHGVRGLRVGFVRHFHERDMIADPEMALALEEVARVLKAAGAEVRDVQLVPLQEMTAPQRTILHAEAWAVHAKWLRERPADYAESTRRQLMAGAFLGAGDYVLAQQHRRRLIAVVDDALREVDVLMTVNSLDPPCRIDDPAALARIYPRHARGPFNLTGHPALSMVCGMSRARLPLSVQFVARAFDEATLLRTAHAFERVTEWHKRRPPI